MGVAQQLQQRGEPRPDSGETESAGVGHPRLINGAVVRKVEQAGRVSYVLSDENPRNTAYFGLNAVTHSIVRVLDGRHGVEEIQRMVKDAHGIDCSLEQIRALLRTLQENALLENSPGAELVSPCVSTRNRAARALGWIVQIWFLFKADRLLAGLEPLTAQVARPAAFFGLVVFGALGLVAVVVFKRHDLIAILGDLRHLSRPTLVGILAGTYLIRLAIGICHEIAHGVTCYHFGGRRIKIGAGLYYLAPVFVCDTSAAWLIEKKRNRILVSLAGPLCQMVFGACGAVLFMLPLPHLVRLAAVILIVVGYGENLLTDFNPLLRYDGYYILADLLELPNLRARSFAHLRRLSLGREQPVSSTRERTVYLVYGALAFCYTLFVLFGISMMLVTLARKGALVHSLVLAFGLILVFSSLLTRRRTERASRV